MPYKIFEKNSEEIENIDGGAFNNFSAGGKSGIVKSVLNECKLTTANNIITVDTGLLLIKGVRVKITEPKDFTLSGTPNVPINYHLISKVIINGARLVTFDMFTRVEEPLVKDDIYKTETGTYELEIAKFIHDANGNVSNLTMTAELIQGGGGSIEVDSELSTESENPVQNKVVANALESLQISLNDTTNNFIEKTEELETANKTLTVKTNEMQTDINQLYLYLNATVTGTEELTQEYSERQTADGLSGLIDGALTRVAKIQGNTVKSKNLFDVSKVKNMEAITNNNGTIVFDRPGTTSKTSTTRLYEVCPGLKVGDVATLTFKLENEYGVTTTQNYIRLNEANTTWTSNTSLTITQEMLNSRIIFYGGYYPKNSYYGVLTNFQVELGTTATEYTPYFDGLKNSYFKGVKSTNSDGTKTDESFILDNAVELGLGVTIDIQNKKIIDNSKMLILKGTENFVLNNWALTNEWGNVYQMPLSKAVSKEFVSSEYEANNWGGKWKDYTNVITTNENLLLIKTDGIQSVDEFKAYLAQQYANGTPVTIRYVSTTGTETDLAIPTDKYQAWVGGSETQVQGDTDNSEYGANNTITQTYVVKKGGAE